jgi:hypothetical protein
VCQSGDNADVFEIGDADFTAEHICRVTPTSGTFSVLEAARA